MANILQSEYPQLVVASQHGPPRYLHVQKLYEPSIGTLEVCCNNPFLKLYNPNKNIWGNVEMSSRCQPLQPAILKIRLVHQRLQKVTCHRRNHPSNLHEKIMLGTGALFEKIARFRKCHVFFCQFFSFLFLISSKRQELR